MPKLPSIAELENYSARGAYVLWLERDLKRFEDWAKAILAKDSHADDKSIARKMLAILPKAREVLEADRPTWEFAQFISAASVIVGSPAKLAAHARRQNPQRKAKKASKEARALEVKRKMIEAWQGWLFKNKSYFGVSTAPDSQKPIEPTPKNIWAEIQKQLRLQSFEAAKQLLHRAEKKG